MKPHRHEDKLLLERTRKLPCVVCGSVPSDVDHIKTRGSGGDDSEANCWPLCRGHHIEKHKIGLNSFAEKYQSAREGLLKKGWFYDYYLGRWNRHLDSAS